MRPENIKTPRLWCSSTTVEQCTKMHDTMQLLGITIHSNDNEIQPTQKVCSAEMFFCGCVYRLVWNCVPLTELPTAITLIQLRHNDRRSNISRQWHKRTSSSAIWWFRGSATVPQCHRTTNTTQCGNDDVKRNWHILMYEPSILHSCSSRPTNAQHLTIFCYIVSTSTRVDAPASSSGSLLKMMQVHRHV
jgi:hypothetical protein